MHGKGVRSTSTRRVARMAAAALAGAAGIGGEGLLLSAVGLVAGQARAAAFGLAAWLAAWALGAHLAGRGRAAPGRALLAWGLAAALAAPAAILAALGLAGTTLPEGAAVAVGTLLIAATALPQGAFLPLLARAGRSQDVSWLFGANLVGGVLGARGLAFDLPAAAGLGVAAGGVGALALLAAALGRLGVHPEARPPGPLDAVGRAGSGLVVGWVTAWLAGVEWIGFRLGALWLGGMQTAVTAVLAASLLALAAGAVLLPRVLPRDGRGPVIALVAAAAGGLVLVAGDLPGRWIADPRGTPLLTALALVGPPLVPLGAMIPLLHRGLEGESGARLGGLLLHEAWGALLGVPLAHLVLVPRLGAGGAVGVLGLFAVPALLALPPRPGARFAAASGLPASAIVLLLSVATLWAPEPALIAPALARPEFQVVSFSEDAHFAVTVVDDGLRGERTLLTDDFRATAVGDDYLYMRVLGHLPLLLHPAPRRVAVLAFGTGTTAGAVARHPEVERIEVLELSPAVCAAAHHFQAVNGGVLDDPRTRLHLGDGRRTLGRFDAALDVLTMEPLLPDSPFAVHLYTPGFYARARGALAPGGLLCQWVPPHALEPATFDAVVDAFTRSFPWSAVFLFGTQVILIGGEARPALDPARFPAEQTALHEALASLGLADPAGAAARFVAGGEAWPGVGRPLDDRDPWVIYRPRRRGNDRLADLPANLARLRRVEQDLPDAWALVAGPGGLARLADVRRLHRALEAWQREEFELRRSGLPAELRPPALPPASDLGHLEAYRSQLEGANDPEVRLFEHRVGFQRAYRDGARALALRDPRAAFDLLRVAGRLRPERADVHLHAALAAYQAGNEALALDLARAAYAACPGLLGTSAGRRLLDLGLPPALRP